MADIQTKPTRLMPAWLSIGIIIACLALAGGVAWWYWHRGWADNIVMLDHNPNDGVHPDKNAKNQWDASAGPASAKITRARNGNLDVNFYFNRVEFLSSEQINALSAVKQIATDRLVQKELGITPEQLEALSSIRAGAKTQLNEAEEHRIREAFLAWEKATGADAKLAADGGMVRTLDAIAAAHLQATRTSGVQRAELAKKTLTDQQWKQYDAMGK
ncbi:MAG: hypothetical protein JWN24_678 [Phycisphaerales bacterium]|nr:hypothetical protein [Phycisphaerales bacterium]